MTANMPIPCHMANELIKLVANQRTEQFNVIHKLQSFRVGERVLLKAHRVGKTIENTAAKYFRLYNGPFSLREQVGKNTFIVAEEQWNNVMGKYTSPLCKFHQKAD